MFYKKSSDHEANLPAYNFTGIHLTQCFQIVGVFQNYDNCKVKCRETKKMLLSTLNVEEVFCLDEGLCCYVSLRANRWMLEGQHSSPVQLSLILPLCRRGTVLLRQPESQQVDAGGSAQFTCSALTDPALLPSLTISWLRNEKPIGG
jgi:hypothetical protein